MNEKECRKKIQVKIKIVSEMHSKDICIENLFSLNYECIGVLMVFLF